MKLSEKQQYKDMISINFYQEEIEKFIKFLDYAQNFCEERDLKEDYKKAELWQGNFKLIYNNWRKKKRKRQVSF